MSKLSKREQKTKYAAIAQSVERILGKDEVGSSNLPSSSKSRKRYSLAAFLLCKSIAKNKMRQFPAPSGQPKMMCKNFMRSGFCP